MKRKDLIIINNIKYNDLYNNLGNIKKSNIGTLYIKVNIKTLSNVRSSMIKDDFTTRLFVVRIKDINIFYIYGKKKGKKGTFNEHCKSTYYKFDCIEEFYKKIIEVSSNKGESIVIDSPEIKIKDRLVKLIEKE